jgi:hypothetical protein
MGRATRVQEPIGWVNRSSRYGRHPDILDYSIGTVLTALLSSPGVVAFTISSRACVTVLVLDRNAFLLIVASRLLVAIRDTINAVEMGFTFPVGIAGGTSSSIG